THLRGILHAFDRSAIGASGVFGRGSAVRNPIPDIGIADNLTVQVSNRRPVSKMLLGHPQSDTDDTLNANPLIRALIARTSLAESKCRLASSAKKLYPVARISARNAFFGSQWTIGSSVWNSIGNHRFGVVKKAHCRATRQHS